MKGNALSIAIAAWILILLIVNVVGHGQERVTQSRFEYKQFDACGYQESELNKLGSQGWRLVSVYGGSDRLLCESTRYTLIREIGK